MTILFPIWLLASFGLIYFFMTTEYGSWAFSSYAFKRYLLFVYPISIAWVVYILTSGNWSNIKNKIRLILVASSVLLVLAFTMIQWTSVTTLYGQYGTSVKRSPGEAFLLPSDVTSYEAATLYREAIETRYDTTFKKIWTFDTIVFFSIFLVIYTINKNIRDNK
jgi:hypothetical protein